MKRILLLVVFYCFYQGAISQNFQPDIQLFSSDNEGGDTFSYSIALNGDYVIVGAPGDEPTGRGTNLFGQGAAYLYKRDGDGNWNEVQKLTASNGESNDTFGRSVAISDQYIAVGAYQEEDAGAVYVFTKNAVSGLWEESFIIRSTDSRAGDQFGDNVNISGDQIIVGVPAKRSVDPTDPTRTIVFTGTVFVFQYNPTFDDWNQVQKIENDEAGALDFFGLSVAVEGDNMVVGAQTEDLDENEANELNNAGAAYLYERNGSGQWNETQKIVASNRGAANAFGYSVAISGDRALIGTFARSALNDGQPLPDDVVRAAYIFEKNQSNIWIETNILTPADGTNDFAFGNRVILKDSLAIVSGSRDIYTFSKDISGNWPQVQKLSPPVLSGNNFGFGFSVAIHEKDLLVGEYDFAIPTGPASFVTSAGTINIFRNEPIIRYSGMGFTENAFNDGSLVGSMELTIELDTFATAGTTLATPADYAIDNLPEGLTPTLTVAANGLSATLTLNGNAANSQTIDDVSDLVFTFKDAAFKSGDVSKITDAVNGSSSLGITYIDGLPSFVGDTIILASENTESGLQGDLAAFNGDSEVIDQDITYAIGTGGDNDFFTITPATGEIFSTVIFDFENPADQNMDNDYVLNVTISDGTNDTTQNIYVRVRDENEFPEFPNDNQLDVAENTTGFLQNIMATDGDAGAEDENLTYSITEQLDHTFFTISPATGEVSLVEALDFETPRDVGRDNIYSIEVSVTDGVNMSTRIYDYAASDVNELPFLEDLVRTIAENSANGSIVLEASALFPDPEEDVLTYSIVNGNDSNTFAVNTATGELTVSDSTALDFELNPAFTLNVEVTDGILTNSFLINVNLSDVNEPVSIADANFTIDENPLNGTVVGQIIAIDPDANSDIRYFITAGDTDNTFAISETGELSVNDSTLVDFEVNPVFTLTVQASSLGSNAEATITININDVTENATPTDIALSSDLVNEGLPIGSVVATLSTADADANDSHTYTLSGTDAAQFSIAGNDLQTAAEISFMTNQSFDITITTDDSNGGSFSKDFTLNVNGNPAISVSLPDLVLTEGFSTEVIVITGGIVDPNQDEFTLTVFSENELVATASVNNDEITISEAGIGQTNITLTATDANGGVASVTFLVTIEATVTSVNDTAETDLFTLSPNPVSNMLHVKVQSFDMRSIRLEVLDTSGKRYEVEKSLKEGSYLIDTRSLGNGIYLLSVQYLDKVYTKKFMKN